MALIAGAAKGGSRSNVQNNNVNTTNVNSVVNPSINVAVGSPDVNVTYGGGVTSSGAPAPLIVNAPGGTGAQTATASTPTSQTQTPIEITPISGGGGTLLPANGNREGIDWSKIIDMFGTGSSKPKSAINVEDQPGKPNQAGVMGGFDLMGMFKGPMAPLAYGAVAVGGYFLLMNASKS